MSVAESQALRNIPINMKDRKNRNRTYAFDHKTLLINIIKQPQKSKTTKYFKK